MIGPLEAGAYFEKGRYKLTFYFQVWTCLDIYSSCALEFSGHYSVELLHYQRYWSLGNSSSQKPQHFSSYRNRTSIAAMSPPPALTLYTSKTSVFAQRVNILLNHLQVPFEEVQIPLDRPREPWFLALNPHGLVPTLAIEDASSGKKEVVIESALICRVLLDLAPGWGGEFAARADEISPRGHDLATVTRRYRQSLFLDTYFENLRVAGRSLRNQRTDEAQQAFVTAAKELDPLCPRQGLYFGDSKAISLVEVITGPYLMRLDAYMRWGLIPDAAGYSDRLQKEAPNFYAWMKMLAADERIKAGVWEEEVQRKYNSEMLAKAGIQVQK